MSEPSPSEESGSPGLAFEDFLVEHFGSNLRPRFDAPLAPVGVFLCFVNRSGSNHLAECLGSSGNFPRAREFFLRSNLLRHRTGCSDLSGIFEKIVSDHTVNGVFAAKLGYAQLAAFDSIGFLRAAFERTRFIFLKRQDTLAQAISLEMAAQNRQWKPEMADAGKETLVYSRKRIELKEEGIRRKYDRFDAFFSSRSLAPFTVIYEELVSRPTEIVAAAGAYLDYPLRLDPAMREPSAKDPDSLKNAWRGRFLDGK